MEQSTEYWLTMACVIVTGAGVILQVTMLALIFICFRRTASYLRETRAELTQQLNPLLCSIRSLKEECMPGINATVHDSRLIILDYRQVTTSCARLRKNTADLTKNLATLTHVCWRFARASPGTDA